MFFGIFAPKFFKEFLLTRDIVNFSFFSVLEKFNYKKFSHIDRLSYHIFKLVVFGYAINFFFLIFIILKVMNIVKLLLFLNYVVSCFFKINENKSFLL